MVHGSEIRATEVTGSVMVHGSEMIRATEVTGSVRYQEAV